MVNPVLVEATRGGIVESRHRGAVAVSLASGELILMLGDASAEIFPRSCAKPFQALPLLAAGGEAAFGLSDEEIAIVCASHSGEPAHVAAVHGLLARIGLAEDALECGPAWPFYAGAARAHAAAGGEAAPIYHGCSGKHAGMLALARLMGVDHRGYAERGHPVQERIAAALDAVCGVAVASAPCGVDGCSVPTWALPATAIARGYARLANGDGLGPDLADAARRIREAMSAAPFMVAGSGRFCTRVMEHARGRAVIKTGAEGVLCAGLPARGLGIVVKCDDGSARGVEVAMAHLLAAFGAADADDPGFARMLTVEVTNARGIHTGDVRASAELRRALARTAPTMIA